MTHPRTIIEPMSVPGWNHRCLLGSPKRDGKGGGLRVGG